ncbi:MAG: acyl-homoserine-lactone synthase [Alphaproteobacteria bacterium]
MLKVHPVFPKDRDRFAPLLHEMFRQRYEAFVEVLKWNIPNADHENRLEIDAFDGPDTVYLLVMDDDRLVGAQRQNPSTGPTMISVVWSQLCVKSPPVAPNIWESSRAHMDPSLPPEKRSQIVSAIICSGIQFARLRGICQLLMVSGADDMPRWERRGLMINPLGPRSEWPGSVDLLPYAINVTAEQVAAIERGTGFDRSLLVVAEGMPLAI